MWGVFGILESNGNTHVKHYYRISDPADDYSSGRSDHENITAADDFGVLDCWRGVLRSSVRSQR
jgi:hypothetical protein